MKKWLVHKCVNFPIVRKDGYPYDSDCEASFDTRDEAEKFIKQRNKKNTESFEMNTLEGYILKQIKEIESRLNNIKKEDYSTNDFNALFNRLNGQKDILYQCLTAHDNTYCVK